MRRLMDGTKRRLVAGLAVTAALLVPLAVLGGPALARGTSAAASQYQYQGKVQVCHRTHSKKPNHQWVLINVGAAAVPAHLRHGDFLVSVTAPCPPKVASPLAPTTHGHGHGNGKGHGK